ncbi:1-acyl-sn-glycerol-3-phosphate acyltransferase [Roseococcus sp. XZZS9]|uniref:1-acyl-sn-glycerol-3-phosphate acyltransferase n=1 Tax=Roseococcus pinisoli TaxID=2835040 RepID=A0ABS5QA21_9PROT|nr:1-acyl-sn-glycerol-3-phosphate acyltransferase [Roseococcus pinisoli]
MLLLRSLLFNVAFFGLGAFFMVLGVPLLLGPRRLQRRAMRGMAQCLVWTLCRTIGVTLRVTGSEHLPTQGAALIAAKHQSAFDTLIWFTLVPDVAYVMKKELFLLPFYGWFARRAPMIGVDRSAGGKAMRQMMRDAREVAREERQIVIFPEGTRTAPGQRIPYQPGVVALASSLNLPVIPVATNSGRIWGRRNFLKRPGTLEVRVLPPLTVARGELLARLEQVIETEQLELEGAGR